MKHLKYYEFFKINEGLLTTTVLTGASIYFFIRFIKDLFFDYNRRRLPKQVMDIIEHYGSDKLIIEEDDNNINLLIRTIGIETPNIKIKIDKKQKILSIGMLNNKHIERIKIDDKFIEEFKKFIKERKLQED